jgi:hypothetical protein
MNHADAGVTLSPYIPALTIGREGYKGFYYQGGPFVSER